MRLQTFVLKIMMAGGFLVGFRVHFSASPSCQYVHCRAAAAKALSFSGGVSKK